MLTFELKDGNLVKIDRQEVEEKILGAILDRLDEAKETSPAMYSALKGAVNLFTTFAKMDLHTPKGESSLDYLILHFLSLGLDVLEQKTLYVEGSVIDTAQKEAKQDETNRD